MAARILVVDDEEAARYSMQRALETAGCKVTAASSALAALEIRRNFDPDVILTDVNMPDMDGIAFLHEVNSSPLPPPVIVVTALGTLDVAVRCLREGAFDYLTKPFEIEQLRNSVRQAAERRRLELEYQSSCAELEEKNRRLEAAEEMLRQHSNALEERVKISTQALLETELRYQELFNLAHDMILTVDADSGRILDANLQAEKLLGHTTEELEGMNIRDLLPVEELDRLAAIDSRIGRDHCGSGATSDMIFLAKDGRRLVMSMSSSLVEMGDRRVVSRICHDVTQHREIEKERARYTRELEQKFEQKQKELLESQSRLYQAEKMAALGNLVAGVAHEIHTPLGSINSNNDIVSFSLKRIVELLGEQPLTEVGGSSPGLKEVISIVEDAIRTNRLACERIVKIVRSLRNFARLDEAERKKADIHDGIESTLLLVAHEYKRRVKLVKEYGQVREIECYPNRLNQVFMNLLVNAAQSIEGEGEIRIRTWEAGNTVRIAISDSGRGIPAELQAKVFEPGFTTKRAGLGTGLGLAICSRIVEDHGGRIELESSPGRGATFTVVLPIQREETNG